MPATMTRDFSILVLQDELRMWHARGIQFMLTNDGDVTMIVSPGGMDFRTEARKYNMAHDAELRNYLAFTQGRDTEDALQHLDFAKYRVERGDWGPFPGLRVLRGAPPQKEKP